MMSANDIIGPGGLKAERLRTDEKRNYFTPRASVIIIEKQFQFRVQCCGYARIIDFAVCAKPMWATLHHSFDPRQVFCPHFLDDKPSVANLIIVAWEPISMPLSLERLR